MKSEADRILAELEALLAHAKPVPLTDQVRIDKRKAQFLLSDLRQHIDAERRGR